jgi:hypothetical protein
MCAAFTGVARESPGDVPQVGGEIVAEWQLNRKSADQEHWI